MFVLIKKRLPPPPLFSDVQVGWKRSVGPRAGTLPGAVLFLLVMFAQGRQIAPLLASSTRSWGESQTINAALRRTNKISPRCKSYSRGYKTLRPSCQAEGARCEGEEATETVEGFLGGCFHTVSLQSGFIFLPHKPQGNSCHLFT